MVTPELFIETTRSFIGTPFEFMGRSKRGVDCLGLFYLVLNKLGMQNPLTFTYATRNTIPTDYLNKILLKHCEPVNDLEPCLFVQMHQARYGTHYALFTGNSFIHASSKPPRKVIEQSAGKIMLSRVKAMYRIKGVTYG